MKSPTAFRTISEVAADLNVPQHVLRFWETRFTQIKPLKRQGGRRYYRPEDVRLLRGIRTLLYGEGYRIDGVQKLLKERGAAFVSAAGEGGASAVEAPLSFGEDGDETISSGSDEYDAGSSNGEDFAPAPPIVAEARPAAHALSDENRRRLEAALAALERVQELLDKGFGSTSGER